MLTYYFLLEDGDGPPPTPGTGNIGNDPALLLALAVL